MPLASQNPHKPAPVNLSSFSSFLFPELAPNLSPDSCREPPFFLILSPPPPILLVSAYLNMLSSLPSWNSHPFALIHYYLATLPKLHLVTAGSVSLHDTVILASLPDLAVVGLLMSPEPCCSSIWCKCFSVVLTWPLSSIRHSWLLSLGRNPFFLSYCLLGLLFLIVLCWCLLHLCTALKSWGCSEFCIELALLILGDLTGWSPRLHLRLRPLPWAADLYTLLPPTYLPSLSHKPLIPGIFKT